MVSVDGIDFAALFDAEPTPCAVLSPDLVIRQANAAYLRATTRQAQDLVGRGIWEAFPGSPDNPGPDAGGPGPLVASLQRAIASGHPDGLEVLRCDVCDAEGRVHRRFWNSVTIPVKGPDGKISLILHRVEDVTDAVSPLDASFASPADREPRAAAGPPTRDERRAAGLQVGTPADLLAQLRELQDSIEELRRERDQLAAHALRDPLTGALSRSVFYEELTRALARLSRRPHPLAVLFVDLDRLKQVNDCHGHAAGDELIRHTVRRLAASVRPSDAIARFGGDEFVILLDDLQSPGEAETIAERILSNLSAPCPLSSGVLINPSASVGVALAGNPDVAADTVLSHADAAMYKAKQAGRGRYELFDAAAYTAATARVQLETELRRAIQTDQLALHYQPIYDLTTGVAVAVEALLRWNHPLRGTLTADAFIDVAEDSGLLTAIGPWVIAESCRQLARWDAQLAERSPRRVFINLSVGELVQPGLLECIETSATIAGVAPGRLVIEVTESGMLDKPESVSDALNRLLTLGCEVAIDDFGTGYSSLSRLVELPAAIIKIDRSFVRGLARGHESAAVIAAVLLLAHNLRKSVVAEGVEDADSLATLAELGCEQAQGYHLGRPQPAEQVTEYLRRPALVLG